MRDQTLMSNVPVAFLSQTRQLLVLVVYIISIYTRCTCLHTSRLGIAFESLQLSLRIPLERPGLNSHTIALWYTLQNNAPQSM